MLSGGGVKGIGLVGAVVGLMDGGYRAQRVSGTSAGSIVGAIVAAASMGDQLSPEEVKELALQLDYHKFTDPGVVERLPVVGPSWAVLRGSGIYKGDYAHDWVRSQLKNLGVGTFGDLAIRDENLPPEQRYKLVVTVADVTTGQLVRLPWDYRRVYGLDPDEQSVADAVRASMAIPFFFRPVTLRGSTGLTSTLVDGGILSNFPIDSLDRPDGRKPRWPSFGVTVLPNLPEGNDKVIPALAPLRMLGAAAPAGRASSPRRWSAVIRPTSTSLGSTPARSGWTRPTSASSTSTSPTTRSRPCTRKGMPQLRSSCPAGIGTRTSTGSADGH